MTRANARSSADLLPGTLVNARYRVVGVIGRGGLATVYRADDESLGRTVALKVISGGRGDADDARRHEDEVRLIAGFDHPGLVTLFDFVPVGEGPTAMLVMQFVDGTNLATRIARGALTSGATAEIGADVAAALAHIHSRGVIHRDVKPANILLPSPEGRSGAQSALLADFGIARLIDDAGITSTGVIVGTASYLSPEQATGDALGPPTDVYSLGLVLLECLTATRAFPGNAVEAVAARLSADPDIPEAVPAEWAGLLRSMLARAPEARPDAAAVEQSLRAMAGGESTGPTLVMPAVGAAANAVATERLVAPAATELLAPAVPRPRRAPRAPSPFARVAVIAAVALSAVILLALVLRLQPPGTAEIATPPAQTPSTTTVETAVPIGYPDVDGDLGQRLVALQQSVGSLGSPSATDQLQALVLEVTELSADGDYESALSSVERLRSAIDDAELTAAERDAVRHAADQVRASLDKLAREQSGPGGPGNGDKPGKKP